MTDATGETNTWIPDAEHRADLNTALLTTGADTGFWDDHGRPAPCPDDINEWRPFSSEPTLEPGKQPF